MIKIDPLADHRTDCISLNQFVKCCNECDLADPMWFDIMSPHLRALSRNRNLIFDTISQALNQSSADAAHGAYTSNSIVLYRNDRFSVRANLWQKSKVRLGSTAWDDRIYSYSLAHNHDFELLTVGYLGPGYSTELWEVTDPYVFREVGDAVKMIYKGIHTLGTGDIFFYRRGLDVHTQLPPSAFSISLNLIPSPLKLLPMAQYAFDVASMRVSAVLNSPSIRLENLFNILRAVPAQNVSESLRTLVESIAQHSESQRVKHVASKFLQGLPKEMSVDSKIS